MKSLSKELFIMALLLMIVVFMIGMIFYQYMPNNKTVPEPVTYTADSTTTAVLQEIAILSSESAEGSSEPESIIKSYSIGTKELSTAAARKSYTSGKTDPFAEYKVEEQNINNTTENTTTNNNSSSSSTQGTTQNSSSTGTFFESQNSK